ncbi:hypothetical protein FDP41_006570 [Naegleria fowleri]|uniref:TmcB/TmcC TPR repeats domain-containing protein n=1 Tax=Naegleria fowleri TaxID=5763 RepID=A0A6A5BK83_NAEFO|nr:uncharacterized protein FDP41_006570 [Naegleria fowleri]KAF0974538.1 hypothetical protein FDP41_006570 [Naegleria fowleri]
MSLPIEPTPQQQARRGSIISYVGGAGGESYLSIGSETSSSTNADGIVFTKNLKEFVVRYVTVIQDKPQFEGKKYLMASVAFHCFVMWTSVFLPTLGDYSWGSIANWIFTVANYPITFSLNLLSYFGMIGVGTFCFVIVLMAVIVTLLSFWVIWKSSKKMKQIKMLCIITGSVLNLLCMTMSFVLSSFIECDFEKKVYFSSIEDWDYALVRYPSIQCFGEENKAPFIMSILVVVTLMIVISILRLTWSPGLACSAAFKTSYDWPLTFLTLSKMAQLFFMYFIPSYLMYLRACLHLGVSLVWIVILFWKVPFTRRFENSIYSGVALAKVGASIGSLVSSLVNKEKAVEIGLAMFGLTIALIIIGFLFGYLAMDVYVRLACRSIRNIFHSAIQEGSSHHTVTTTTECNPSTLIEKEAYSIYSSIVESRKVAFLKLFIRFCTISSNNSSRSSNEEANSTLTDSGLVLSFIKGVSYQKQFINAVSLVLISSLFLLYNSHASYALSLAKRLYRRKLSLFEAISLAGTLNEIDSSVKNSLQNIEPVEHYLVILDSNYREIKGLHKEFLKELANDSVNIDYLELINSRCSKLMAMSENIISNVHEQYRHDRGFLRAHAQFLEEVKFDKESANEIYSEIGSLEEDSNERKRRMSMKSKKNQVQALGDDDSLVNGSFKESSRSFPESKFKRSTVYSVTDESNKVANEIEADRLCDDMDGVENDPYIKKQMTYQSSLWAKPRSDIFLIVLFIYGLLSLLILIVSMALSVYFSQDVLGDVRFIQQSCEPTVSTYAILRNVRNQQAFNEIIREGVVTPNEIISSLKTDGN